MTPVKIAVMGAGLIGKRHAEHVASEAGATLCAIIDPSEIGRTLADRLGALWYRSFGEMIQRYRGVWLVARSVEEAVQAVEAAVRVGA